MTRQTKVIIGGIATLFFGVIVMYLSGIFFFLLRKEDPTPHIGFFTWLDIYAEYGEGPKTLKKLKLAMLLAVGTGFGLPGLLLYYHFREQRSLHGDARFAKKNEVEAGGLLGGKGLIVGKYNGQYLCFDGQQFAIIAAPTRSGKGVGVVLPNLLNYPYSVVCLDIKNENFDLTSGYRKKHGQDVFLFNSFAENLKTHRYNPLSYVRAGKFRVADFLSIASVLYPKEGKDTFWNDQAKNLFLGLGLLVCETPYLPRTIGELLRQSAAQGLPIKKYLSYLIEAREIEETPFSKDCTRALHQFMAASDNTRASILSSFNAPLVIWASPIVDAATSGNDFDLREVRKKRMTIYVAVTPDYLKQAPLLFNLFFSQLIELNTKELPSQNEELIHPCLLLLDEFTSMGRVEIIAKAVSYIAGYNLRLMPIIQSVSQLENVYPREAKTIMTNHALQVVFAPKEQDDAEEYSKMLGYQTVKGKSKSRQLGGSRGGGRSISENDQRRALMLPQEMREMGQSKQVVLLENQKPILCEKVRHYEDPELLKRTTLKTPTLPQLDIEEEEAFTPNLEVMAVSSTQNPNAEKSR